VWFTDRMDVDDSGPWERASVAATGRQRLRTGVALTYAAVVTMAIAPAESC
jgi:hypothetical protein